uniref:Uncharacterized protein n=1 Tax=Rhizophora mucronata TaxID=61149 RepID=A0A2P2QZW1_RHIMU
MQDFILLPMENFISSQYYCLFFAFNIINSYLIKK